MIAVISDIHSNIDALEAVIADIEGRNVEQIICLGDVIGYGPQPRECLDRIMEKASVTLMGNHDFAVFYEPGNFNMGAETACFWTRQELEDEPDDAKRNARWEFLGSLPVKHTMTEESLDSVVSSESGCGTPLFVTSTPTSTLSVTSVSVPEPVYSD